MQEAIRKAEVLLEALPYIRKFHRKTIVIKYGGSILGEEKIRHGVLQDIVFLSLVGIRIVLVHGGGPNISERMRNEGRKTDFVDGMRVTDAETLKVVEEELWNLNQIIVKEIESFGTKAQGLSGKDNIIKAEKKKSKIDLGLVGQVCKVNTEPVSEVLKSNAIAVILPMGQGLDNKVYNVNADEVASAMAQALKAEKLVILTNVAGIMRDPEDPNSFISSLNCSEAEVLIKNKVIQSGMIPKVKACIEAIKNGVVKAHIIDARIPHGILLEIFTDKGIGTEIVH